jgi:hypothetical protein
VTFESADPVLYDLVNLITGLDLNPMATVDLKFLKILKVSFHALGNLARNELVLPATDEQTRNINLPRAPIVLPGDVVLPIEPCSTVGVEETDGQVRVAGHLTDVNVFHVLGQERGHLHLVEDVEVEAVRVVDTRLAIDGRSFINL